MEGKLLCVMNMGSWLGLHDTLLLHPVCMHVRVPVCGSMPCLLGPLPSGICPEVGRAGPPALLGSSVSKVSSEFQLKEVAGFAAWDLTGVYRLISLSAGGRNPKMEEGL